MKPQDRKEKVWVIPRHWDKFQNHKDRNIIWIRVYTGLLDSDDYLSLTPEQRALLLGIWLAFAKYRGTLLGTPFELSRVLRQRVTRKQLEALEQAGYIMFSGTKPDRVRYGFVPSRERASLSQERRNGAERRRRQKRHPDDDMPDYPYLTEPA